MEMEAYLPPTTTEDFFYWRSSIAVLSTSTLLLLYVISLVIHRFFLSPLAKFPGSKLAALTGWYELYYDVVGHKGKYLFEIEKMHDVYGGYYPVLVACFLDFQLASWLMIFRRVAHESLHCICLHRGMNLMNLICMQDRL